jgi:ferritin-like protein
MKEFHDMSACPPALLPKDPKDTKEIVKVLLKAEQCAVKGYSEIASMVAGKDHRTYELVVAILNEEIEHEAWFTEFLGKGPSGHFRRQSGTNSPFVSKFLQ